MLRCRLLLSPGIPPQEGFGGQSGRPEAEGGGYEEYERPGAEGGGYEEYLRRPPQQYSEPGYRGVEYGTAPSFGGYGGPPAYGQGTPGYGQAGSGYGQGAPGLRAG